MVTTGAIVADTDRQEIGFTLGTLTSTIIGAPVNLSLLIYGIRYANPATASGTVTAQLTAFQPFPPPGMVVGTIDVVTLTPNLPSVRDAVGERPLYRLQAGQFLLGVITSPGTIGASLQGALTFAYIPGR